MAEDFIINKGTKEEQYRSLIPQVEALIRGETHLIANLANMTAALKTQFDFFWVGFYLVQDEELILGPFQGPVACTRIQKGRGVCGTAWKQDQVLIVPDVHAFDGHIACSSASKSEIVIPFYRHDEIIGVLDVDSDQLNSFDEIDAQYLQALIGLLHE